MVAVWLSVMHCVMHINIVTLYYAKLVSRLMTTLVLSLLPRLTQPGHPPWLSTVSITNSITATISCT